MISAGDDGIVVENTSAFSAGISNSGTVSGGAEGIYVSGVTQFGTGASGGISNSGTISAGGYGIYVYDVTTFFGGISNSGTISAGHAGIDVESVTTFSGGITNSGTISSAGTYGIYMSTPARSWAGSATPARSRATMASMSSGVTQFGSSSAGGGITNSGTISRAKTASFSMMSSTFPAGSAIPARSRRRAQPASLSTSATRSWRNHQFRHDLGGGRLWHLCRVHHQLLRQYQQFRHDLGGGRRRRLFD